MSLRREEKQVKPGSDEAPYRARCAVVWKKQWGGKYVYTEYDGTSLGGRALSPRNHQRARKVFGWLCLLAAVLMYAPLAGAMLVAHGMDCCTGGYCKIPTHHHKQQKQQTPQQEAPIPHSDGMNCEHEMGGMAMTSCSMTCCQDPSRPALMPVAFVLPAAALAPKPGEALRPALPNAAAKISRFRTPLSPPPRSLFPTL